MNVKDAKKLLESQLEDMLENNPDVGTGDWLMNVEGEETPVSQEKGHLLILNTDPPVRFRFRVLLEEIDKDAPEPGALARTRPGGNRMKLDSNNVLKALLDCIAGDPHRGRPMRGGVMRLVVDFPITDADDEMRIKHPDEFEFDANNQTALDAIQSVVDGWESKGTTIDQGGDAGHYELSLADGCEVLELDDTIAKAKQILDDVARALRDAGIPSAPAIPDAPEPAAEAT